LLIIETCERDAKLTVCQSCQAGKAEERGLDAMEEVVVCGVE